jgi:hypothetical protein
MPYENTINGNNHGDSKLKDFMSEAQSAFRNKKEAAAKSVAYLYLLWRECLSSHAKPDARKWLEDRMSQYNAAIGTFNERLGNIDSLVKQYKEGKTTLDDLTSETKLQSDHDKLYRKALGKVLAGEKVTFGDYKKIKAEQVREEASPFTQIVKYVFALDRREDSSTTSRYAKVLDFVHGKMGNKSINDPAEIIDLLTEEGGFEVVASGRHKSDNTDDCTAKLAERKSRRDKSVVDKVRATLKTTTSVGSVELATSVADGELVVIVGRAQTGTVQILGELQLPQLDDALRFYHNDAAIAMDANTKFVGKVVDLSLLVSAGRITNHTEGGTQAGRKEREMRCLSALPDKDGSMELVVSARYAEASVVVKAKPKGLNLGSVPGTRVMKPTAFEILCADLADRVNRRFVTITANPNADALCWNLTHAPGDTDEETVQESLAWLDPSTWQHLPLDVEGFAPNFNATITRKQIADLFAHNWRDEAPVSTKTTKTSTADSKTKISNKSFCLGLLSDRFHMGGAGEALPSGVDVAGPTHFLCREADAHALMQILKAQEAERFDFSVDPRGLLAVHWEDKQGSYDVFVPSRTDAGGLNPKRMGFITTAALQNAK